MKIGLKYGLGIAVAVMAWTLIAHALVPILNRTYTTWEHLPTLTWSNSLAFISDSGR
jgi:hypothetical protein